MAKKALGRGLEALIPQNSINTLKKGSNSGSAEIEISKIKSNKNQPRKYFNNEELQGLAASIESVGIIEPLVLRKKDRDYEIITGERRWRAAKLLGLKKVPAIVKEIADDKILEMALIENIQREDLNPIEEAEAFKELIGNLNLKQEELAKRIGKSRAAVTNTIRLLTLPAQIRSYIIEGTISAGHARALLRLKSKPQMEKLARSTVKNAYSVRELEKITSNLDKPSSSKSKKQKSKSADIVDLESRLQEIFGTKVSIKHGSNGGKIEISYYSLDDLDRILETFE